MPFIIAISVPSLPLQVPSTAASHEGGRLHGGQILRSCNLINLSKPTPPEIKVQPILIANLPAALTAPILSPLDESRVSIEADLAVVQLHAVQVADGRLGVVDCVVLDETEATWSFLELVKAHHNTLYLASAVEKVVDLCLGGEVGQIADVEAARLFDRCVIFLTTNTKDHIGTSGGG